jgi:type I restriction enzyme S subunit
VSTSSGISLGALERQGDVKLFRGKVISKRDISAQPGPYPIYSSSVHNNGLFGNYGRYMFDEELITWSVDGGGHFFYRPRHKFSVTNVCGYLRVMSKDIDTRYLAYYLQALHSRLHFDYTLKAHPSVIRGAYRLHLPSISQQRAVARALAECDGLLATLERLIAKKQAIKRGMMQLLLSGRTHLPGFRGRWLNVRLGETALILDNLRVPLSAAQRATRFGPYPYCGANNVVDYIDDFMIDDDVILLAEDGGYFDEFATRAIAYRMRGRIWVNNHAHVLKAASGADTGYLFYALQHKDITPYISSSTRSKLTRGELVRIEVALPPSVGEQRNIALILEVADAEIECLRTRLAKAMAIKQGMLQELLTGKTRLPVAEALA